LRRRISRRTHVGRRLRSWWMWWCDGIWFSNGNRICVQERKREGKLIESTGENWKVKGTATSRWLIESSPLRLRARDLEYKLATYPLD
jgi:hypothetical protein